MSGSCATGCRGFGKRNKRKGHCLKYRCTCCGKTKCTHSCALRDKTRHQLRSKYFAKNDSRHGKRKNVVVYSRRKYGRRAYGSRKYGRRSYGTCGSKRAYGSRKYGRRSYGTRKRAYGRRGFGDIAQTTYPNVYAPYFGAKEPFVNASGWWYPVTNGQVQSPHMLMK